MSQAPTTTELPKRRYRWRFGLRSLMLLGLVVACALGAYTSLVAPYWANQRGIAAVARLGGTTRVEWQGPQWLSSYGEWKVFERVTAVDLSGSKTLTDDDLACLAELTEVRVLNLQGTSVSDRACDKFRHLAKLTELNLGQTKATSVPELSPFPNLQVVEVGDVAGWDMLGQTAPSEIRLDRGAVREIQKTMIGHRSRAVFSLGEGSGLRVLEVAAVGQYRGSQGIVSVCGPESWLEAHDFWAATWGKAELTAARGARVEIKNIISTSLDPASELTWTVEGPGTRWTALACELREGTATLVIRDGAHFGAERLTFRGGQASTSRHSIHGEGTRVEVRQMAVWGAGGNVELDLADGALLETKGMALTTHKGRAQATVRDKARWKMMEWSEVGAQGEGTLTLRNGGTVDAVFLSLGEAKGTVSVGEGCTLRVEKVLSLGGTLVVEAGATFTAGRVRIGPTGELFGARELPKTDNRGLLAVGKSGEVLKVSDRFTQELGARLQVQLGEGTAASQLRVDHSASLAGALELQLAPGVTPAAGTSYTIISAKGISGRFDRIVPPPGGSADDWQLSYTQGSVVLTYRGQTAEGAK